METLWFGLIALMIALYVVFDGFDLGAGLLHLIVARGDSERRSVLRSIGPFWDGNEVWLIAAGGALYFAFPGLYASGFSGFYLPLMIALWLLILRGISLEFRSHLEGPVWAPLWDTVFSLSSFLLALVYGVALGNVVRGVPLDTAGRFFVPLWTNLRPRAAEPGVIDGYTLIVGATAVAALALHGSLWLSIRSDGALRERARRTTDVTWWAVAALTVLLTILTFKVQPLVAASFSARPWGYGFPLATTAGLVLVLWFSAREQDIAAFLASSAYLAGMLGSAAFGLYPYLLPATTDPSRGLTVWSAAAPPYGLGVGLVWWIPGMVLVAAYFVFVYRRFAGRRSGKDEGY